MPTKEFKTVEEQINILTSRGLIITDPEEAKDFLLKNNYYRISGYSLTLRSHDTFFENVNFKNIIDIYKFDHELRHILLRRIEEIEVAVKSVFAYEFSKVYGAVGYLNASNFENEERHKEIIGKAEAQKSVRLPHEPYLKHFVEELKEDVPLWAYVDLLTISDISFLYSISKKELKKSIALALGIEKKGDFLLEHFMHRITIIRNLCAHGSRLYNRLFEQKPRLSKKELKLLRVNKDGSVDNAHLYGFIIIMRKLLCPASFAELKNDIISLTKKYPFIKMRYYGFADNWQDTL